MSAVKLPARNVHWSVRWLYVQFLANPELTERKLAERAGIDAATIRRWRRGERVPTISNLEAVFNVLGYELKASPLAKGRR